MTHQLSVAARLAQLRRKKAYVEERDVTQQEVAEAVGLLTETFSRYENGKRKVPDEVVIALAQYYGVTAGFIRYGEESSPDPTSYVTKIPDVDAEAASRERAAKLATAHRRPTKRAAAGQRRKGRPTDDR